MILWQNFIKLYAYSLYTSKVIPLKPLVYVWHPDIDTEMNFEQRAYIKTFCETFEMKSLWNGIKWFYKSSWTHCGDD